jgi:sugar lactone lactonase YvrE
MIDIDYINSPNEDHCEGIIWIPKTNEVAWVNVFEKPKIITYNIVNKKILLLMFQDP